MTTKQLQFQGIRGNQTTFVDPSNVATEVVHNFERLRRNVGKERLPFYRQDLQFNRAYVHKSCSTAECGVEDITYGRVTFAGVKPSEVLLLWEDMKVNVDTILAAGVLNGIRAPINLTGLIFTPTPSTGA